MRGPSQVEADLVALAEEVDTGEAPAQRRAHHLDVRKLKSDFPAAVRTHHAPAATSVEAHQRSLVKVAGKAFTVELTVHSQLSTISGSKPQKKGRRRVVLKRRFKSRLVSMISLMVDVSKVHLARPIPWQSSIGRVRLGQGGPEAIF